VKKENNFGLPPIEFDPGKIKYNSDGVPVLSAREIETVASELLQRYCPGVLCAISKNGFPPTHKLLLFAQ
jgi:hypothetical protein